MVKILIIEQDSFFADLINQKLQTSGFGTLVVGNGSVALEQMRTYKPDLVILDMELATSDAVSLLQEKNKDSSLSGVPVIIISRSGELSEIKRVIDLGVKDYMVKTQLNLDELIMKISSHTSSVGGGKVKKALDGKVVMWVEDDQFLSDLISRKLSTQGCKLVYARTGEDALKTLETTLPDVIILDILLPGISGFDVLEKIKSDDRVKRIPVIILSNFSQNSEIDRGKKLGASRFLVKASIVLDDLVRELQAVLKETNS